MIQPKVIPSSWFPFGNYIAITLYKWIFIKKWFIEKYKNTDTCLFLLNQEKIHLAQLQDLIDKNNGNKVLGIFEYYGIYLKFFIRKKLGYVVWLYNYTFVRFGRKKWYAAYEANPLEREANEFEQRLDYLSYRKPFKWRDYS